MILTMGSSVLKAFQCTRLLLVLHLLWKSVKLLGNLVCTTTKASLFPGFYVTVLRGLLAQKIVGSSHCGLKEDGRGASNRAPAIVKHSRFCARAGSTWKSPPTLTSNMVADANWQTAENSLKLHPLSPWLENQYPLATAIATPSNSVTMTATKRQAQFHRPRAGWQILGVPQSNRPSRANPARGLPPPQSNCGYRLCRPAVQGKRALSTLSFGTTSWTPIG